MKCYSYTIYVGEVKGCGRNWRNLFRAQYWESYDKDGNYLGRYCCSKRALGVVFSSDYAVFVQKTYA